MLDRLVPIEYNGEDYAFFPGYNISYERMVYNCKELYRWSAVGPPCFSLSWKGPSRQTVSEVKRWRSRSSSVELLVCSPRRWRGSTRGRPRRWWRGRWLSLREWLSWGPQLWRWWPGCRWWGRWGWPEKCWWNINVYLIITAAQLQS